MPGLFGDAVKPVLHGIFMQVQRLPGRFQGQVAAEIRLQNLAVAVCQGGGRFLQVTAPRALRHRAQQNFKVQLIEHRDFLPARKAGEGDPCRLIGAVLAGEQIDAADADLQRILPFLRQPAEDIGPFLIAFLLDQKNILARIMKGIKLRPRLVERLIHAPLNRRNIGGRLPAASRTTTVLHGVSGFM